MGDSETTGVDPKPGPALQLRRNQRLGKYRLVKCVGRGGYCDVWKARDTIEGIWVALKIPQLGPRGRPDNQMLLREVRLVSQLRHPNIMPVKNAELLDGYAVLATELSDRTLDDCSRPMAPRRIIAIISDVLRGLAHAHGQRVVHCDVTPGNIFLLRGARAAIGDFGIGVQVQGRMKTIDDYGTPGYVAPEQAYGRPTYRSDCFAVGLILYEFLTGYLPRWPFKWPMRGADRLQKRTSGRFVEFLKKALAVDPARRFAGAAAMLTALQEAVPRSLRTRQGTSSAATLSHRRTWQQLRTETFLRRYGKVLDCVHTCVDCGEPISEAMQVCPWCGSRRNRFDDRTVQSRVCPRCHRGMAGAWSYCPWCYGAGFAPDPEALDRPAYHGTCRHCGGRIARFMRYCPWCRRKIQKAWDVWPFPERCSRCGWSVDSTYWHYCPWCTQRLLS